ncbi:MAG: tetratricopeptide repeat protein, partial [Candidatus Saccharicenans sp.]|nr:tetratricopeptide repeat protein [Candidatus Saccharicenans sp.]
MNGKIDRIKIIGQAERLVRAGKLREAIAEYEKILEEESNDVTINNTVGDLYARLGQNERAIRHFERAASEYERKAQYSQALAILKKICRLNPESPVYFVRMADLYARQGFTAEAKKEYLTVAEKYLQAKNVEEAIELYEKVVRLDRDDLNVRMQLAALYKLNGQIDRAVGELLEAADLKLQDGRIDEAHKFLTEARKLNPENPRLALKMAQVLRVKGQTSEAIALVQAALEKNPNELEAQTFLGNLYFEEGKFQAAR